MDRSKEAKSPTKLCLIGRGSHPDRDDESLIDCYYVFVLDPSENCDEFMPRVPDLKFEGLGRMSFCVLNSSIYMFESYPYFYERDERRTSVYTCDLSAFLSESENDLNSNNSNSMLQRAPSMHGVKENCHAVVTPRGKILAFSGRMCFGSEHSSRVEFELYDPVAKSWRVLPPMCPTPLEDGECFIVSSYGFLSVSLFCVTIMLRPADGFPQAFVLDLESLQWNDDICSSIGLIDICSSIGLIDICSNIGCYDLRGGGRFFFVLDDELCLTCMGITRPGDGDRVFNFPYTRSPKFDFSYREMSLISNDQEELRFCNMETVFENSSEPVFYTTVHVGCCDLAKYKAEMKMKKEDRRLSSTGNSFKFIPKVEESLYWFEPEAILPFGPDAFTSIN